jgi:bifunctional DNA-binding transcriptional regulator/antitoxin component of YhaV-PrlF toxin-antitoxin module
MIALQTVDRNLKIKLPVEFLTRLKIRAGENLHAEIAGDRLILRPAYRRKNYPSGSAILKVQKKIERINNKTARAKGLTKAELDVAIQSGLIDKKQAWFWTMGWQKMEKEADRSRTFEFDNVKDALEFLHK